MSDLKKLLAEATPGPWIRPTDELHEAKALLTPEQWADPGVGLAFLFGTAMTRTLTAEEVARAMELLTALRVEATEDAYRRVGKVVDDVLKERAA